ncbi:MAG TPA: lysylphosphatidylglycerol synthase transmembrane domain-containing protein [Tepidisphaeraceae bacterium]
MEQPPENVASQPPRDPAAPVLDYQPKDITRRIEKFLTEYFWFILRNVIGWILILIAPALGVALPGPGGLPVFLIGFALVTFPGKRKFTARFLRGRRLHLEHPYYTTFAAFVAIVIPGITLWIVATKYEDQIKELIRWYAPQRLVFFLIPLLLITVTWLVTRLSLNLLNLMLKSLPLIRRKMRPWLRRWGVTILPPRKRQPSDEILELDPSYRRRFTSFWKVFKPWLFRLTGVAITVAIFFYMFRKIALHWHEPAIRDRVLATSPLRFLIASLMFAVFLFAFRAFSWRKTLKGFGYKLPYGAAVRIWAGSELARYLPGSIWQVVGRVYLSKPYGVPGSIVSTSQILELATFLLANVLIAVPCLLFAGTKKVHIGSAARPWFFVAMALAPLLSIILHPKVFYGITNRILDRLGKPPITKRLRGYKLFGLLLWAILGLAFQSLAIFLLVQQPLKLPLEKLYVVAGAYSLAWIAGFLAIWASGGLGVRELVFVAAMRLALPPRFQQQFTNPATLAALLAFLSLLLRLFTIAGELILTSIACAWDYRGFLGLPNAPGRIAKPEPADPEESPQTPASSAA